ncbi:MAG: acetylornithine deacetylase [Gammaproteobacteria bacterium]
MHSTPLPSLIDMLRELVALPSVSSADQRFDQGNRAIVERLAEWLTELGFSVELRPLAGHPDKLNLIASLGQGTNGLVLAGHTDTVPYDEALWASDPFTLSERDGRLYGLGVADMKCFFPIVLDTLRDLDASKLRRPLLVLATADEESSMAGARQIASSGRGMGRYVLIGEPTGLTPVRMHKGVMMLSIRLRGRAGHASDPRLGNNAIDGMHAVLGTLIEWRKELQAQYRDPLFTVPEPTVNLGSLHGGDSPNRICAECEVQIDVRLLPGMDAGHLAAQVRRRVAQVLVGSGLLYEVQPLFAGVPPLDTPARSAIVQVAERLTGVPSGSTSFATEGPFYNAAGMETVVLGAGDIAQAHQPNEYVARERLAPMQAIVTGMVQHFCVEG